MSAEVHAIETNDLMIENMMIHIIKEGNAGERHTRRFSSYVKRTKKEIVRHTAGSIAELEEDA